MRFITANLNGNATTATTVNNLTGGAAGRRGLRGGELGRLGEGGVEGRRVIAAEVLAFPARPGPLLLETAQVLDESTAPASALIGPPKAFRAPMFAEGPGHAGAEVKRSRKRR